MASVQLGPGTLPMLSRLHQWKKMKSGCVAAWPRLTFLPMLYRLRSGQWNQRCPRKILKKES
jgi:hypothetical protein